MSADADLLDIFHARSGIVCAVGAGGKKSVLYRLLRAHAGRAAFTSTVFTHPFPADFPFPVVVAGRGQIVDAALRAGATQARIAYVRPSDKPERYAGLLPEQVMDCHLRGHFDLTLVKADGARMRLLKGSREDEPVIVPGAVTVLGLVSVRAVGLPLTAQHAHRPERIAAITGARVDAPITAEHVARLIAAQEGLFKGAGHARALPVINMADRPEHLRVAREIALRALDLSPRYDRVVITSMRAAQPVLDVVERPLARRHGTWV